ncbi:hypothetical protein KIL84_005794 [Mauremys mutica]|uniref:Uncharacterized protein n=1 Tax=Mauremys mutica TaxID=74926 RepID=A0A9D4B420_9SAUR|nr:hypothetical protein KIL84_005794 [Mauremys mutica]
MKSALDSGNCTCLNALPGLTTTGMIQCGSNKGGGSATHSDTCKTPGNNFLETLPKCPSPALVQWAALLIHFLLPLVDLSFVGLRFAYSADGSNQSLSWENTQQAVINYLQVGS